MGPSRVKTTFPCPRFLIFRIKASASQTFPNTTELIQAVANQGSKGKQKQRRNNQETIVQDPGYTEGIYKTISLRSSAGTKAPTQVEDGNFKLVIKSPGSTNMLPHHESIRRKSHTLQTPQILPIITFPQKPSGSSRFLSMSHLFSLLGPKINLSLLQTPTFWFVWP